MEADEDRVTFEARLKRAMAVVGLGEAAFRQMAVETAVRQIERRHTRLAKRCEVVDERLLSRLRVIVAKALREAEGWEALQARLRRDGVEYAVAGGGLALVRCGDAQRLCKASEVGPGYKALVRRMRAGFPGHPHAWIERETLAEPATAKPAPPDPPRERAHDLIDYGV